MNETVPVDLRAAGHLSATTSLVLVALTSLVLVGIAVIAAILARRWNARANRTALLARGPGDLEAGWAVLAGEIEDDEIDAPAVQIDIDQKRVPTRRGAVWRETKRVVRTRPFSLRLDDGRRARVEPGDRVFAIAPLNVTRTLRADERLRAATIRAGKRVVVTGLLGRGFDPRMPGQGYRDAGIGLVLTPPSRGSMLVSTDPIEKLVETQRERAVVHKRQVWLALGALVLGHALMLSRYDALLFAGRTVRMYVVDGRTQLVPRGDHWRTRYVLRAETEVPTTTESRVVAVPGELEPINTSVLTHHGRSFEAEVDAATYYSTRFEPSRSAVFSWRSPLGRWSHHDGEEAPDEMYRATYDVDSPRGPVPAWWRTAPALGVNEIGAGATVYAGSALALSILAGLLFVTYALSARGARPWWERERIEDPAT